MKEKEHLYAPTQEEKQRTRNRTGETTRKELRCCLPQIRKMCAQRTTGNKRSTARETDRTGKELGCCLPRLRKICAQRTAKKNGQRDTVGPEFDDC